MYSNNILNYQEPTTILNACTKKSGNLLNAPRICVYVCDLRRPKHWSTEILSNPRNKQKENVGRRKAKMRINQRENETGKERKKT